MDSELAALAASGATTLVSLMVTDSWTHARELVGRFFSRIGADVDTVADLDSARALLLSAQAANGTQTADDVTFQWRAYLQHLLQAGSATGDDLRDLLASLQRLANTAPGTQRVTVHNDISGGAQHGPIIQSGRITGLTLHVHHPAGSTQD
ncbi:hypothetical protein WKI65_22375 [Streptomyces sp. MS1.AVA.3]|uniref:Uncharacterized protein n=1 Tax=Streptomyces nigrescens TaxID=1920 RepID=A0A640TSC7_STRNI|nr:hypothetical protein [Streptomyces libani]WAU00627.1 hypothetical protein STRLI_006899 [Streptomyces libani subsp. libani]GFE26478.1 hypothetical protein Sliba_69310 [Streptomyces libani subsp. libani]GGW07171.1 hypothetical protein GCM10010500_75330 [Streptomyces libani subsp. libani]